jgi:sulfur carrier protein ThiS
MEDNIITVNVARIGEEVRSVEVPEGATIADLAEAAGIDTRGLEARVGMGVVNAHDTVEEGDTVMFLPKIEGGR